MITGVVGAGNHRRGAHLWRDVLHGNEGGINWLFWAAPGDSVGVNRLPYCPRLGHQDPQLSQKRIFRRHLLKEHRQSPLPQCTLHSQIPCPFQRHLQVIPALGTPKPCVPRCQIQAMSDLSQNLVALFIAQYPFEMHNTLRPQRECSSRHLCWIRQGNGLRDRDLRGRHQLHLQSGDVHPLGLAVHYLCPLGKAAQVMAGSSIG
mmetsp:Transcript_73531/g.123924  ORF Transcript_73531/g.123924 Transcript_73531/m.123924 type:complete len:204 (+) Transcript_73531:79-690(+)